MHTKNLASKTISLFILLLIFALLFFPTVSQKAVVSAIELCAKSVVPSLFPFLVLTRLISSLKLTKPLQNLFKGIMQPVFSLSEGSFSPLLLGAISGYPIGASVCISLYKDGEIKKDEAERLLAFCNNAGPAFILSTIGIGIFSSLKIGFLLLVIHLASAFAVGFIMKLFAPLKIIEENRLGSAVPRSFSFAFTDSVCGAMTASLSISAYIIFFSVITALLNFLPLSNVLRAFICGLLEMTTGAYEISHILALEYAFVTISFFLGFGGFCIHFQTLSLLNDTDLNPSQYFLGKTLQGTLSAILSLLITKTGVFATVATFSADSSLSENPFYIISLAIFLLIFCLFFKKGWKRV